MPQRLDKELVTRGFFATRARAQAAIEAGAIWVNGKPTDKASLKVSESDELAVQGETLAYVSRAGLKLEHAIRVFGIDFANRTMIDIGSSTGGFTDCALKHGAARSYAVDVGNDQLAPELREDSRVVVLEGTDFRILDPHSIEDADIATIDVSFISVTKLVGHLACFAGVVEVVCLVKPQFECGKDIARRSRGVPLDRTVHVQAISSVAEAFANEGFAHQDLCASPIRGQNGNIEYLAHFTRNAGGGSTQAHPCSIESVVNDAFGQYGL